MPKKYVKQFVLIVLISFYSITGHTQTYIGGMIGTNLLEASTPLPFFPIDHNSAWDNKSLVFGIYIEQYLTTRIKLTLQSSFTSKYHDIGHVFALNPITDMEYNMMRSFFLVNWSPLKKFAINIGAGMDRLTKMKANFALTDDVFSGQEKAIVFGGLIGTSYKFKYFRLGLLYSRGFEFKDNFGFRTFFDQFNSLEISLGYEIKLFDKLRKKEGVNCPEF